MIDSKFNRLTVISLHHYDKRHRKHYLCQCECGKEKVVQGALLRSGNTKSCGCIRGLSTRLADNEGIINQIILQYKRHAKNRNLEWHLNFEEVKELISGPCFYCGRTNVNLKRTKNCKEGFAYNGIDRLDSEENYWIDNVVSCCGVCNKAKGARDYQEFIQWAKLVAEQWG